MKILEDTPSIVIELTSSKATKWEKGRNKALLIQQPTGKEKKNVAKKGVSGTQH